MHKVLVTALLGSCLIASTAGFAQDAMMPTGVKSMGGMLTDAKGMTLYTFDKDTQAGKSACSGPCLSAWPALVAPADAKPMGESSRAMTAPSSGRTRASPSTRSSTIPRPVK
jgi:predicted lipoprotein with Yx(FWY)xxD motif